MLVAASHTEARPSENVANIAGDFVNRGLLRSNLAKLE
jgi:hypothetical protein